MPATAPALIRRYCNVVGRVYTVAEVYLAVRDRIPIRVAVRRWRRSARCPMSNLDQDEMANAIVKGQIYLVRQQIRNLAGVTILTLTDHGGVETFTYTPPPPKVRASSLKIPPDARRLLWARYPDRRISKADALREAACYGVSVRHIIVLVQSDRTEYQPPPATRRRTAQRS